MRRHLAAVAITATLLAGTGCSNDPAPRPTVSPGTGALPTGPGGTVDTASPQPGSVPSGGVVTGAARQVCTDVQRLSDDKVTVIITSIGKALEETANNNPAGAAAARRAVQRAVAALRSGLRTQIGRAQDPRLKALLTELATAISKINSTPESFDDRKVEQLRERLDALCGG